MPRKDRPPARTLVPVDSAPGYIVRAPGTPGRLARLMRDETSRPGVAMVFYVWEVEPAAAGSPPDLVYCGKAGEETALRRRFRGLEVSHVLDVARDLAGQIADACGHEEGWRDAAVVAARCLIERGGLEDLEGYLAEATAGLADEEDDGDIRTTHSPLGTEIVAFGTDDAQLDALCVRVYGRALAPIANEFLVDTPYQVPADPFDLDPDYAARAFAAWRSGNVDDLDAGHIVAVVLNQLHADGHIPAGLYLIDIVPQDRRPAP